MTNQKYLEAKEAGFAADVAGSISGNLARTRVFVATRSGLRGVMLLALLIQGAVALQGAAASKDQELFNQAKVLMFEQKWDGARQAFQRLIREFPQSNLLSQAYFHSAYCLQLQKKPEDALAAYTLFLQKYPKEPVYGAQARQTVVQLAATLFDQGKTSHRGLLVAALTDPDKDVRYLAALRCSSLKDRQLNTLAVPVLREIIAKEKQQDLIAPASLALLRIQPEALEQRPKTTPKVSSKQLDAGSRIFHIQIFEHGESKPPSVELNIPVSFAQIAIAALDEPTKAEMRRKGFDIENIWSSLNRMGPTNIFTARNGTRVVKLWIQ
jgi:tetratricopeptide (TPR) repeat protein